MAGLYYGNGNCSMDANGIRGIHIKYKGNITILEDKTPRSFNLMKGNNGILIYPIRLPLDAVISPDLFVYTGTLEIISVMLADKAGNPVTAVIKPVTDYAEHINSHPEDMTTPSEDFSAGIHGLEPQGLFPIKEKPNIIENLDTAEDLGHQYSYKLYHADGTEYKGKFHIHTDTGAAMVGAEHTEGAEELYILKKGNGDTDPIDRQLTPISSALIPMDSKVRRNRRMSKSITTKGGY